MRCRSVMVGTVVTAVSLSIFAADRAAGQAPDRNEDKRAILAAAKEYVAALDRGDAKELAAFWMPEGNFVDETGQSHPASELIAEAAASAGSEGRPQVKLLDSNIRFLSDDVAIEDGTSEVSRPGGSSPSRGRFSAIWVRSVGRWRLGSLREARIAPVNEPARLSDLAWMIGRWEATSGETTLESSARWNATETFLLRDLKVSRGGKVIYRVAQRVGWDPLTRKLKSWIFDSDGGYGDGIWTKQGDGWAILSNGVLPDGRQIIANSTLTRHGPNDFHWESNRSGVDHEPGRNVTIDFKRLTAVK